MVLNHLLQDVPIKEIKKVMQEILLLFEDKYFEIVEKIEKTCSLDDETGKKIVEIAKRYLEER